MYFRSSKAWMENPSLTNTLRFKVFSLATKFYLNFIYVWLLYFKCNKLKPKHKEEVIVSLTTFPARINKVWITIETIFQQKCKPDRIILWLAKEQFPEGIGGLPKRLQNQMGRGLEIRFCDDLRSHKKYFYTMQENPSSVVITVDDDVFYPLDTIGNLKKMHKEHPDDVIAHSAQEIGDDFFSVPSVWHSAHFNHVNDVFGKCRILGLSGILYPPRALYKDVLNKELILKLCPWADDLWLTIMTYLNGRGISRFEFRSNPLDVVGSQRFNLSRGG